MASHTPSMVSAALLLLLVLLASRSVSQAQSSVPTDDASRIYSGLTAAEHAETTTFLNLVMDDIWILRFVWSKDTDICNRTAVACSTSGVSLLVSEYASSLSVVTITPPNFSSSNYANLVWDNVYLNTLDFSNVKTSADVNRGINQLNRLRTLAFSNTGLSGQLPDNLNDLTLLNYLKLDGTSISGSLPSYSWPNMFILNLSNTNLTSTVPSTFVVNALAEVDLSGTSLEGCLPTSWSAATKASVNNANLLDCGTDSTTSTTSTSQQPTTRTSSTSPAPTTTTTTTTTAPGTSDATRTFLQLLFLAMPNSLVNLSDTVDYCHWNTAVISCNSTGGDVALVFQFESVTGTLPEIPSTVDASDIQVKSLYLSGLSLTGTLPSSWGNLTSLKYLDLSMNRLSGCIPDTWNGLTSLITLQLSQNYLSGNLPAWNLPRLSTAYLSNNRLAGSIPASWGQMPYLQRLSVNGNSLCGCLPSTWPSSLATATAGMAVASSTCATANACTRDSAKCVVTDSNGNGASYMTSVAAAVLVLMVSFLSVLAL